MIDKIKQLFVREEKLTIDGVKGLKIRRVLIKFKNDELDIDSAAFEICKIVQQDG